MPSFGTDQVLLYNIAPWNAYGFGVPNFGENVGTLNLAIAGLVNSIGVSQLYIMTSNWDSSRTTPPSMPTVMRIGKLLNRIHNVLTGRMVEPNEIPPEPGHASPATQIWTVHPVPYFRGPIVRNSWLEEYNQLCMIGMMNMMQHTDNSRALYITRDFAEFIWQYFNQVKKLLGRELLKISTADLAKPDFEFTDAHYSAYNPRDVTMNIEAIDQVGQIFKLPSDDDLKPLLAGIPADLIIPNLARYPVGQIAGADGLSGVPLSGDAQSASPGAGSGATAPILNPPSV